MKWVLSKVCKSLWTIIFFFYLVPNNGICQINGGEITFGYNCCPQTGAIWSHEDRCYYNTTNLVIYNFSHPTGGSGQYIYSWEEKYGANWVVFNTSDTVFTNVHFNTGQTYYRRKAKDANNLNDSAYSNILYTKIYTINHGLISFAGGSFDGVNVLVGAQPPFIYNYNSATSNNDPPVYYGWEYKVGVNDNWHAAAGYNESFQPPTRLTPDTVIYRRYSTDGTCYDYPGGTNELFIIFQLSLPLKWLFADVVYKNNLVHLYWKVANEINNAGFEILRSYNGTNFSSIASVKSKGNSSTPVSYTFVDDKAVEPHEDLYYKIKQTDKDGHSSYSEIIKVKSTNIPFLELLPNPVIDIAFIRSDESIRQIIVMDYFGRVLKIQTSTTNYSWINVAELPKGLYLIKVKTASGKERTVKMIK